MRFDLKQPGDNYKITFMVILLFFCTLLTYYFHFILSSGIVFTHFFYVPIILAALWWKRKGILVALFLGVLLVTSDIFSGNAGNLIVNDSFRSVIFILVGIVVVLLSENIEKSRKIIEKSEEKYKSVVETAVEAIITFSDDSHIVSWNKGAEKIFGYTQDEILGKCVTIIMPKRYHQRFKESFSKFTPTENHVYMDKMVHKNGLRKDGSEFPFDISIVHWKAGEETFFTAIIRDVTEQKMMENELKSSKKRFETLFEYAPDAYYINDIEGNFIDGNRAAEKLIGYKKEDLIGTNFMEADMFPLNQVPNVLEILDKNAKGFPTGPNELTLKTKDGNKINVELRTFPIELDNKRVVLSIARDITLRKKAEEVQARLAAIVEYSDDAIIGEDLEGTIINWNKGAEKIYGYKKSEIIGKNHSILISPEKFKEMSTLIEKVNNGEVVEHYQTIQHRKDGKEIDVSITISPIRNQHDRLIGSSIIARDITQLIKDAIALKESEELFRTVFNNVNDVITLIEIKEDGSSGRFIAVNEVAIKSLGYNRQEFLNMTPSDIGVSGEVDPSKIRRLLETGKVTFERTYITKNGNEMPVEINSHIFNYKGKRVALSVARDISGRKKAEEALRESEEKYRLVVETAGEAILLFDKEGNVLDANHRAMELTGLKREDLIGINLVDIALKIKINVKELLSAFDEIMRGKSLSKTEWDMVNTDGDIKTVMPHYTTIKKDGETIGITAILEDVTKLKQNEKQLINSLEEKEMLLKEIHHRVKNNLMVISSLLNLQSRYIKDKAALDIFKETQNRAKSMAIIHERLYRSTDLKRINFGEYIRTLTTELFHTYVTDPSQVRLNIKVEDLMLDINTAIPLGLILNELVSNSMKHAFPEGRKGEITIELHSTDSKYMLNVKDDGIGFPKDLDYKKTRSLGLQLVNSLTDQIGGSVALDRTKGTTFKITFTEEKFDESSN